MPPFRLKGLARAAKKGTGPLLGILVLGPLGSMYLNKEYLGLKVPPISGLWGGFRAFRALRVSGLGLQPFVPESESRNPELSDVGKP